MSCLLVNYDKSEIIKSSKNVNAVLYQGFYYDHFRTNKNSVQHKCREKINGKECNQKKQTRH